MDKELETTDRGSNRRGFFDLPSDVVFWMNVLSATVPNGDNRNHSLPFKVCLHSPFQ